MFSETCCKACGKNFSLQQHTGWQPASNLLLQPCYSQKHFFRQHVLPPDAQLARIPSSPLPLLLRSFVLRNGHKRGHKKGQLFIPERWLHLDSLPVPFPLPTLVYTRHRCLTPMPAFFLKSLPAAAGPLRWAFFPRLSLLLQADGCLPALLPSHVGTLKPSASHVNCKNLENEGYFPPFPGSVFLFAQARSCPNQKDIKAFTSYLAAVWTPRSPPTWRGLGRTPSAGFDALALSKV